MLTRDQILQAFQCLSDRLGTLGLHGEISLLGGTAMVLAFQARQSTKDVDAIFTPASEIRDAARAIALDLNLPPDWLNDAAKGFASTRPEYQNVDGIDLPHLRVQAPVPEYLLAMKVLAARAGVAGERGDKEDIAFLIRLLNLRAAPEVLACVERYYDPARILPRSMYLVDEIFEEMAR